MYTLRLTVRYESLHQQHLANGRERPADLLARVVATVGLDPTVAARFALRRALTGAFLRDGQPLSEQVGDGEELHVVVRHPVQAADAPSRQAA